MNFSMNKEGIPKRLFKVRHWPKRLEKGLRLDKPNIFIPFGIDQKRLLTLLKSYPCRKVSPIYYVIHARPFGSLDCKIGFHFKKYSDWKGIKSIKNDRYFLYLFEFFRDITQYSMTEEESFQDFQTGFEDIFGLPQRKEPPGEDGFPAYSWHFENVIISHYTYTRYMLEDHMIVFIRDWPLFYRLN